MSTPTVPLSEASYQILKDLAERTGRQASNLSRTLKTMERYGIVRLHRGERGRLRPEVPYQSISLELPFTT